MLTQTHCDGKFDQEHNSYAAKVRKGTYSTYAATRRTGGHVSRNIIVGYSFPWSAACVWTNLVTSTGSQKKKSSALVPHRKHNEVIKRNLTNIGLKISGSN